jgi:hypothetical protein
MTALGLMWRSNVRNCGLRELALSLLVHLLMPLMFSSRSHQPTST